jgi:hypothetical protein
MIARTVGVAVRANREAGEIRLRVLLLYLPRVAQIRA